MTYICPICGKSYSKPADLSACVQKCANEVENRKNRADALDKEIKKTYAQLKGLISEYNTLEAGQGETYTSTLSKGKEWEKEIKDVFSKYKTNANWKVNMANPADWTWTGTTGGTGGETKVTNSTCAGTSSLEDFLKSSLNIEDPKSKSAYEDLYTSLADFFNQIL